MKKRWIILALICIGFILLQSAIPESISAHESTWLTSNIVNPVWSWFGLKAKKDVVRKIAHATEFFILALVLSLWCKKPIKTFYAGFTLAFLDESLQMLTDRGASLNDIWIDLIGVTIGALTGWIIFLIKGRKP